MDMRYWKRILSCLLAGSMAFALAACSRQGAAPTREAEETPAVSQAPAAGAESPAPEGTAAQEEAQPAGETGNTLVVYFSATGHTEAVADHIAQATGGGLFEIVPAEPYTDADLDWTDESSRVVREYEDESLRDVELTTTEVEGWEDYDTVFIGYPIWWGIAAWPVDSFVSANDFTGKTVIPFCTSSSSGLGGSGELLAELAGTGDWLEGQRFRSSASQEDVAEWVDSLGLSAAQ